MARIRFRRPSRPLDVPAVSIRDGRFHYNAAFGRLAELEKTKSVAYHLEADLRGISFEFSKKPPCDAYPYAMSSRGEPSKMRSSVPRRIMDLPWVGSVVGKSSGAPAMVPAKRDGNSWTIRLCPTFEIRTTRSELLTIPADAVGIYRYRSASDIVYIGKGAVRRRALVLDRAHWVFDSIEYSIVADADDQFAWESYWIDRFKETANGALPLYNRQAGSRR